MYAELVTKHLVKETERYMEPVIEFKNSLSHYGGVSGEKSIFAYRQAVKAMSKWVKMILSAEVMLFGKTTVTSCKLLLLDNEYLFQSVGYEELGGFCDSEEYDEKELITPIGVFSQFMYRAITEIQNNPVKMFYESICACVNAGHCFDGFDDRVEYCIPQCKEDVLGVYQFDIIADSIKRFINSDATWMLGRAYYSFKS